MFLKVLKLKKVIQKNQKLLIILPKLKIGKVKIQICTDFLKSILKV